MTANKYKYLLSYRYSEIIHDLTMDFVKKYIDYKSRTKDQMEQAARSGKQNIVEGVGQAIVSKKGEIKLLGVASASLEELLMDYEDFLRQHKLRIFEKGSTIVNQYRKIAYELSDLRNLSNSGLLIKRPKLSGKPEADANFLLTLCHLATYVLNKQIGAMKEKFVKEGGMTENLFRERNRYIYDNKYKQK